MTLTIEKPKYRQIADMIRSKVKSGELEVGDPLPSLAQMYRNHGATQATMQRVYDLLEKDGLIERRSGSGVYVAERKPMRTGNIGFIGSATFRAQQSPYYVEIARGVQDAVQWHERRLLILGTDQDWARESFEQVDGLIVCGRAEECNREIQKAVPAGMPCVSLITDSDYMSSVVSDDYRGGKIAVQKLLELGHRRIACLMRKSTFNMRGRFAGYRDALQEAGITPEASWMQLPPVPPDPQPNPQNWGREQMEEWLSESWAESRCTALLVQTEAIAVGVMRAFLKAGIAVPDDVSVVGFDGTELCDYSTPRLAAVRLPLEQMGHKAVDLLVTYIEGEHYEKQTMVLPAGWKEGDSVAPPRGIDV